MKPWWGAVVAGVLMSTATPAFAAGPFLPYAGTYVGLTYPQSSELAHAQAFYLRLKLNSDGMISGKGTLKGVDRVITGEIGADGKSSITFLTEEEPEYNHYKEEKEGYLKTTLHLTFDFAAHPPTVSGFAEEPEGISVFGQLVNFDSHNPARQAGKYTVVFMTEHTADFPDGAGFGLIKVTTAGDLKMQTYLQDGGTSTHSTKFSENQLWPMYIGRYDRHGSVLGNLSLRAGVPQQPSGTVIWTKPDHYANSAYPLGWTNLMGALGSPYVPPSKTSPSFPFQAGVAVFSGADLTSDYSVPFVISGASKVITSKSSGLVLKLTASNGMFSGSFKHPVTAKKTSFKGAVLQEQGVGYGYFLTPSKLSGLVYLGPAQ